MPSQTVQIQRLLQETVLSLERLEKPLLARMGPLLRQAEAEVVADLKAWLEVEDGAARFTAARLRNALAQLKRARGTLAALGVETDKALKNQHGKIAARATMQLHAEWATFGKMFEGTAIPLPIDEAAVIARSRKLLWPRYKTSAARYAGNIGDRIRDELAVSRLRGETMFEASRRLEKRLPHLFESNWKAAERLARTETMNAYAVAHQEALREAVEEDPDLVSRWDASFDWRRCPLCASLDGQTAATTKGETFNAVWTTKSKKGRKTHALKLDGPPAHPNCRCVATLWKEKWGKHAATKNAAGTARAPEFKPGVDVPRVTPGSQKKAA